MVFFIAAFQSIRKTASTKYFLVSFGGHNALGWLKVFCEVVCYKTLFNTSLGKARNLGLLLNVE